MAVALRLARGGAKKRPYYRIVATDSRNSRDGKFIEKIGTFNPMLPKDSPQRLTLVEDRVKYWLGVGAQPSERVHGFLFGAGLLKEKLDVSHKPQKSRKNKDKKTRTEVKAEGAAKAAEEAKAAEAAAKEAAAAAAAAPAAEEAAPAEAAAE